MALLLTGIVSGMRVVQGVVDQGPRKGDEWKFLSLEIIDNRYGKVYSCQLKDRAKQFQELVSGDKLKEDWTGHLVKATISGQSASQREIEDKETGSTRTIIQIRSQVEKLVDLGLPKDDE